MTETESVHCAVRAVSFRNKRSLFLVLGTKPPIRWSSSPWCNHYIIQLSWLIYSERMETLNSLLRNFNIGILKTKFGLNRSKWADRTAPEEVLHRPGSFTIFRMTDHSMDMVQWSSGI